MNEIKIKVQHNLGDLVYLVTDLENEPLIITGIKLRPGPSVSYIVSSNGDEFEAYAIELSATKNIV